MNQRTGIVWNHLIIALLFLFSWSSALGWGQKGHELINEAAILKAPLGQDEFPKFFKHAESIDWIVFQGPEPDRWKERSEYMLRTSESPNHYLDFELLEGIELPKDRYTAIRRYMTKGRKPEEVGLLPYAILETFEKLRVSFREYRKAIVESRETLHIGRNAIYCAGLLGHYVGDGSQPLHLTIHYDGWRGENPKGYRTEKGIHSKFESDFVSKFLALQSFHEMVTPPKVLDDPFEAVLSYLKDSHTQVERVYQLEKQGQLDDPSDSTKAFVAKRLAAGSQMLLDLWWTAWEKSKK